MLTEMFSTVVYELAQAQAVAVRIENSRTMKVAAGRVWITRSDDVGDYWLDAGGCLDLKTGETLWISAEDGLAARVVFRRPARSGSGLTAVAGHLMQRAFTTTQRVLV